MIELGRIVLSMGKNALIILLPKDERAHIIIYTEWLKYFFIYYAVFLIPVVRKQKRGRDFLYDSVIEYLKLYFGTLLFVLEFLKMMKFSVTSTD